MDLLTSLFIPMLFGLWRIYVGELISFHFATGIVKTGEDSLTLVRRECSLTLAITMRKFWCQFIDHQFGRESKKFLNQSVSTSWRSWFLDKMLCFCYRCLFSYKCVVSWSWCTPDFSMKDWKCCCFSWRFHLLALSSAQPWYVTSVFQIRKKLCRKNNANLKANTVLS